MASSADLLAELREARLPDLGESALLAEILAALALGLLAALIVALLARLVARRPQSRRQRALAELAASRRLPRDQRLLAQARLLRALAAEEQAREGTETEASDWRTLIDRRFGSRLFAAGGAGQGLEAALYHPGGAAAAGFDADRLDGELTRLLKRLKG